MLRDETTSYWEFSPFSSGIATASTRGARASSTTAPGRPTSPASLTQTRRCSRRSGPSQRRSWAATTTTPCCPSGLRINGATEYEEEFERALDVAAAAVGDGNDSAVKDSLLQLIESFKATTDKFNRRFSSPDWQINIYRKSLGLAPVAPDKGSARRTAP